MRDYARLQTAILLRRLAYQLNRTARDGDGIAFGKNSADGRAARPQRHIGGGAGESGAAREEAHDTGKWNELNKVMD